MGEGDVTIYDLYLESGPRRRKTMVHVLDLLGCVAVGPTTDEALAATPEAIAAFRRFLNRHGEAIDVDDPFETRIVEHVTEGYFIGNGSPYILFGPDSTPVTEPEIEVFARRIAGLGAEFGEWASAQTDAMLDAKPDSGGREAREMLRHVLAARGAGIATALGSSSGLNRIATAAERGELPLPAAFAESSARMIELVKATTPEQRSTPRQLPSGPIPLQQRLRRILEHDWEHLAELSRRPGGPML
jgi:predicted RNase H-like HicB family nuclease